MSKEKENWLVVYRDGFVSVTSLDVYLHVSSPMTKKRAKHLFKYDPRVMYAVHVKKERKIEGK
jgi:hypothetical protein